MKIDKKINWDSFSETEQQAIGISNSNSINGTNNPEFPYIAAVFEAVAEELEDIAHTCPNAAIQFAKEANAIIKKLRELLPVPPTADIEELAEQCSEEELANRLLGCIVCHFLAYQFAQMETQIITKLDSQMYGGENEKMH
ncbi:hypothetical protein [Avibacterium paragallinarum]|uniref:Uncharacterized protein n=1 Tax=Avibacterium paragallinarum TaxID=728 RepID=A0A0F5F2K2_AVIPA|nr:hypothetical protein [Avibacterium paragallinarum]KAA6208936.1 hypothetical protein F1968_06705 [Avibacterium paragallinarum]KKB02432.1 hypothetical protein Z012_01235 [Avibacterium paragallinarum]RZN73985.1 hypothetical protein EIG77_01550 [Avibacterium paragallinarum]SUU98030.1 Uncharacterised protein [Avibacterium paragallinarum]